MPAENKNFLLKTKNVFGIVAFTLILRFVFLFLLDLLPEEAYYWNYSQHLDIGYLDHPPMVAWLQWLSTSIFGDTEFGVRLPAFLCWFVAAWFIFKLTARLFDRTAGYQSILLMAVLPIYFSIGFIMTPDAPLYAAWAGALYFMARALVDGKRSAWYGIGLFIGLGMLSKYSIGLLGLSGFAFIIIDKDSRKWLLRPEPYLSIILALIIFSPVLIWNYQHDWASFRFQGPRRWSGNINFSLHLLILSAVFLITPSGFIEAIKFLFKNLKENIISGIKATGKNRPSLFMQLFAIMPLMVFVFNSLRSEPKFNWTGALWMAVIPYIANKMKDIKLNRPSLLQKSWKPTIIFLLCFYTLGLSYIYLGMPGYTSSEGLPFPTAWKEFGAKVEQIETKIENETGRHPVISGTDRYWIPSMVSFYSNRNSETKPDIIGRHIFDGLSLMWEYWRDAQTVVGRDIIILSFIESRLEDRDLSNHFDSLSTLVIEPIIKNGYMAGNIYWRVGYNYQKPRI